MKSKVMFVHPEMSKIRQVVEQVHHTSWHCVYVKTPKDALKRIKKIIPDIIFFDVECVTEISLKMINALKKSSEFSDILILASMSDTFLDQNENWSEYGIDEIILKPLSPRKLNLRISKMLQYQEKEKALSLEIEKKMCSIEELKNAVIMALGSINEYRDNETSGHACRTQHYVKQLALELRSQGHYKEILTDTYIELLYKSAPLHDIGKIGVSDDILLKIGKLNDEEFEAIKKHTSIGERIIASIISQVGSTQFLQTAMEIAGSHHERWDGTGYPRGTEGEVIPLSARLMGIADAYDALVSNRVYRESLSHEKAVEIICLGKGTYFDPVVVEAFVRLAPKFKAYAKKIVD